MIFVYILISRCQGYSRVIKVIQFLPVYIFIITRWYKTHNSMRNPCVLCNIHGNSPSGLRPRACACIFHKTLVSCYIYNVIHTYIHTYIYEVICSGCSTTSEQVQQHCGVQLDIGVHIFTCNTCRCSHCACIMHKQGSSLSDCLQTTFKDSLLTGQNQYYCQR